MALRDWQPRTIRRLWGFGLLAECLIAAALFIPPFLDPGSRPTVAPDSTNMLSRSPDDPRRRELFQRLRDSSGIEVTVLGDTLTTFTKDSFSVAFLTRGDTIRDIQLSPAAERRVAEAVAPVAKAWVEMSHTLAVLLVVILVVTLLPIPLALGTITLVWWQDRRRATSAENP